VSPRCCRTRRGAGLYHCLLEAACPGDGRVEASPVPAGACGDDKPGSCGERAHQGGRGGVGDLGPDDHSRGLQLVDSGQQHLVGYRRAEQPGVDVLLGQGREQRFETEGVLLTLSAGQ
jgi:hypothetical protein